MPASVLQFLLLPMMAYAACGLVLSFAVHLLSLVGLHPGGKALFVGLHVGIFPLWIPVTLIAMKMTGTRPMSGSRSYYWNLLLSGSPSWMQYMSRGFLIYALINFDIFLLLIATSGTGKPAGFGNDDFPSVAWRGFSGHWMAFYSVGLAVLTAAYQKGLSNLEPKCRNGHSVALGDKFCSTCGASVDGPRTI